MLGWDMLIFIKCVEHLNMGKKSPKYDENK